MLWVIWHNVFGDFPLSSFFIKLVALFTNMGWLGVQLFFVLSGFLITGILLDEKRNLGITVKGKLAKFYWRRSLRIFPIYYFVLIVSFILLPLLGISFATVDTAREHQIWYWTYLINWAQPLQETGGLTHFWSLAIEEQFYLAWPFVVILLVDKNILRVIFFLILSALIFRVGMMLVDPVLYDDVAYMFTVARWDSLAFGALLAYMVRDAELFQWLSNHYLKLLGASIFLVLGLIGVTQNFNSTPVGIGVINQTVAALLFAALICYLLFQDQSSWLTKVLSWSWLSLIGKYSYALYVFHMPVRDLWRAYYGLDPANYEGIGIVLAGGLNVVAVFIATFILSALSWKLIESPILGFKDKIKFT
ncbi:MAG: acyltransferase [Pseudomonadales bacterium]|nr:acyltransferase [Pseudomonadales bacterium]